MKLKLNLITIFALCVLGTAFAQTSNTVTQERRVVELINIERATHLGVGFVQRTEGFTSQYVTYWTQVFAAFR